MALITSEYGAASLGVTKASVLAANAVVVGILDEFNRGRKYSPLYMDGLQVQTGDALTKWLPSVGTVTATQVTDPVTGVQTGMYTVTLIPGTADTANVASVQTIKVDPNALFITATGTF